MVERFPDVAEWIGRVIEGAGSLPGVSVAPHRYGGTEFRLGSREVGHVHRWGAVDVAFTRRLRDALVTGGWTGPHHVYPDSGWTTFRLVTDADVERALALLELSYAYHRLTLGDRLGGLPPFDGAATLDRLAPPPAVRSVFEGLDEPHTAPHSSTR